MRYNTNNPRCLQFLAPILFLLIFNSYTIAQKSSPQNISRVIVTNQYVIENGHKTDRFWAVYQEIYDSLGRLHTEINWDFISHLPNSTRLNTFNGMQKVRTDFFLNEKLQMIKQFMYGNDSLISQEIIKLVKPRDTTLFLTLNYKYNHQNKPIKIEAKAANGKTAYSTKSSYDLNGNELTRKVKTKTPYSPADSIIKLTCNPKYDSIGRLIRNKVTIVLLNNKKSTKEFSYTYDKKNNITAIVIRDDKGKLISREERIFQDDNRNRLMQIKNYDSNNELIKWLAKRYEIYSKNNIWNKMIDY